MKKKERPILFSGPMVKAILEGRKTQTRRPIKPQPVFIGHPSTPFKTESADPKGIIKCPYGERGTKLWVRERFCYGEIVCGDYVAPDPEPLYIEHCDKSKKKTIPHQYAISNDIGIEDIKWKPSIHMPRWASRILLEITDIRVERLQDISEEDASAEGCNLQWYSDNAGTEDLWPCPKCNGMQVHGCVGPNMGWSECDCEQCDTSKKMFKHLWESISGPGSWDNNPFLWVVDFKVIEK
jgi:hypothetical protein